MFWEITLKRQCKRGAEGLKHTISLKENRQFRRLYAKGRSEVTPFLAMYYRRNGTKQTKLGITVSAKLGKAVTRNKVRRRLHEAYRRNEASFLPGFDIVIVARKRAVFSSYAQLERSLLTMAKKAKLLLREEGKRPAEETKA